MPHRTPPLSTDLHVRGLILPVRLGVGEEERSRPQEVRFDLIVEFGEAPRALETDRIEDTICYDELSRVLAALCESKPYRLIEHLGHDAYEALRGRIQGAELIVQVTKLKPPIPGLTEGVSFSHGDRRLRALL